MSSNERNNLEKEVEDAPTPLLDTANEIETTLKNTTQDVSETVTGVLTPANIMVVLGFLGIYFAYSFYTSRNRIGVLPMNSSNLQTSLTIDIYRSDAVMNGLKFDSHTEEKAVELFAMNIMKAGEAFILNPMDAPFIPTWGRVKSAIPDFLGRLEKVVNDDNKKYY